MQFNYIPWLFLMRITLLLNTASSGNGHLEMATFAQQQIANLPGQMYKWPHSSNKANCKPAWSNVQMATFIQQGKLQTCLVKCEHGHIHPTGHFLHIGLFRFLHWCYCVFTIASVTLFQMHKPLHGHFNPIPYFLTYSMSGQFQPTVHI